MTRLGALATIALVCLAGCGGADGDPALDALLRVGGAQFVPGPLPASGDGPAITGVVNPTNTARPGEVQRPLSGTLAPGAVGLRVGLVGDRGHWLVVAGAPDVTLPDQPTFDLQLTFARRLDLDPVELRLAAVDDAGRVGPAQTVSLALAGVDRPEGALVVTLEWDRDADLDLRVTEPSGVEIFARNPSSAGDTQPGLPPTAEQLAAAGRLDRDSNGQCLIDGIRRESVIWPEAPPAGTYIVRVDTFDMCAESSARWRVEVRRAGELVAAAEGSSTAADTRFGHDLGAGVLALTFEESSR